jgi:hypothetical protein
VAWDLVHQKTREVVVDASDWRPTLPHHSRQGRLTARFKAALLLLALVAGFLISTLLYPPAAVGAVVASIALTAGLCRAAWDDDDR